MKVSWDDKQKLIPIFKVFRSEGFTRNDVVKSKVVEDLSSGDICRWGHRGYIRKTGTRRKGTSGVVITWVLSDVIQEILEKEIEAAGA
jgi:hypothetical protein